MLSEVQLKLGGNGVKLLTVEHQFLNNTSN